MMRKPFDSPVRALAQGKLLSIVLVLGLGLMVVGCAGDSPSVAAPVAADAGPPPVDVQVVTARVGMLESALEISGTLAPRSRVAVKPKLPGSSLERVLVDIGDAVKVGQVLATLDRREIDAQVDAATAAVDVAKASLENAEAALANALLERDRAQNLFDKGAVPRQRLDAAATAYRSGVAQRDLAKANLAQANASLRRSLEVQRDATLTAPVNGFVVERHYDPGAIPGDDPVVVIADLHQLKLEAGVSELEAGRLKIGKAAVVAVQAKPGETFNGQLAAIAPEVDERNRHFKIEVRVENPKSALLAGMYATARIVVSAADNAIIIPREAVGTKDGKRVVFKVDGDTVRSTIVVEGLADGRRVQIVSGLASGDRVVADARRQVTEGARVKAIDMNETRSAAESR
jgi:HlyD family secretion protein